MPPPTVPGMPARTSRPARPDWTEPRTKLCQVGAAAGFDGGAVCIDALEVGMVEADDDAGDAFITNEKICAETEDAHGRGGLAAAMEDDGEVFFAFRFDEPFSRTAEPEPRERREGGIRRCDFRQVGQ